MKTPEDLQVGTVFDTNNYGKLIVTSYHGHKKVGVKFLETEYEGYAQAGDIRRGEVSDKSLRIKVGDVFTNDYGEAVVVGYETDKVVTVKFKATGYELTTSAGNLRKGKFKDPYHPLIHSVGYIGVPAPGNSVTGVKSYGVWSKMLSRCYNPKADYFYAYGAIGVTVNDDWLNYQNFRKFYEEDLFRQDGWQIDKDIVSRGNLQYNANVCVFVPCEINGAVVFGNKKTEHPNGVTFNKAARKFRSRLTVQGKSVELYRGDSSEDAFNHYKVAKESYLKHLAAKWKGLVDPRVTESLENWEIFP